MSQRVAITLILADIFVLGFAGVLVRARLGRVIVWLLSFLVGMVGLFALGQGGIAEPFTAAQMWRFCAVTFWPVLGCALGQMLMHPRAAGRK